MHRLFFISLLFLWQCASLISFPIVQDQVGIPNGSMSIILKIDESNMMKFTNLEGIKMDSIYDGLISEEIIIDSRTVVKYRASILKETIKIKCYYAVSRMDLIPDDKRALADLLSDYNLVVYNSNHLRSRKVFDYMVQVLKNEGLKCVFSQY